jgi:hypothetical protein
VPLGRGAEPPGPDGSQEGWPDCPPGLVMPTNLAHEFMASW